MAKKSMARSARNTLKKAARTGTKKARAVAGKVLGAATVAARDIILDEFTASRGATGSRKKSVRGAKTNKRGRRAGSAKKTPAKASAKKKSRKKSTR